MTENQKSQNTEKHTLLHKGRNLGHITPKLVLSVAVSLFGSFQYGWHTGVLNLVEDTMRSDLGNLSNSLWGLVVSLFCIGGLFGAATISRFADSLGRKTTLTLLGGWFILTGILQFVCGALRSHHTLSYVLLLVSRFTAGMGSGAATVVVPMYLGEIASRSLRGSFGTLHQFALVAGILVAQAISTGFNNSSSWKWLLAMTGFLGLCQLLLGLFLLESPSWLVAKNKISKAYTVLVEARGYSVTDSEDEIAEMVQAAESERDPEQHSPSAWEVIRSKTLRRSLLAAIVLMLVQQLSGINAVFYYSGSMFKKAGVDSVVGSLLASGVNVVATGVAVYLIERMGRRPLLLTGTSGMAMSCVLFIIVRSINATASSENALDIMTIIAILLFVSFFEAGVGSIPWLLGAEIFPEGPRATAMGIAAGVNWIANGIIAQIAPIMVDSMNQWTFVPFGTVLLIGCVFTYYFVPETKGRRIADIQEAFHDRTKLTITDAELKLAQQDRRRSSNSSFGRTQVQDFADNSTHNAYASYVA